MEQKIIDIEHLNCLCNKVIHTKKFADLLLIIQFLTYRARDDRYNGISISSSSQDEKWQDASLSYLHIYKAFKINW